VDQTSKALPTSEHFELRQVAEGVYAAFAFSNAGIIDLGGQTLIFDTFEAPAAGEDLRAAAEHLTGRPATYVVISHAHSDHWWGNQAFDPGVPIITAPPIRQEMPVSIAWLQELKEDPSDLAAGIEAARESLKTETDPRQRATLERSIARMEQTLAFLPTLELRFPNLTFDGKLLFHGTKRTAELLSVAPGHTACDAYLVLPEDRIMFMGDLGFLQCQPFMVYCDPAAWAAWLEETERSGIEVFVPGHGPLGTKDDLALQRQYMGLLEELVAQVIREGGSVEDAVARPLPPPFDAWLHGSMARWEANVHTVYERLS
jgi:glyoxylase-like metal-dependent hydrolase (beta-lactamase superfamily II)